MRPAPTTPIATASLRRGVNIDGSCRTTSVESDPAGSAIGAVVVGGGAALSCAGSLTGPGGASLGASTGTSRGTVTDALPRSAATSTEVDHGLNPGALAEIL